MDPWALKGLRAIKSVRKGMSLRITAKEYNISRTTFYQNLSQTSAKKLPLGGKPVLKDLKADLVKHILEMESSLFGITARDLRKLDYQVKFICYKEVNLFTVTRFFISWLAKKLVSHTNLINKHDG